MHERLRPSTASAAVTCRGGLVFHMAPVRIVTATFVPPLLSVAGMRDTVRMLMELAPTSKVLYSSDAHLLPDLFTVFATQNPIDSEGTYPLPEAQLDRFLLKIRVGYPSLDEERIILQRHHRGFHPRGLDEIAISPIASELLVDAQREVRAVTVEDALYEYILALVRRTREWPALALGASPRAALSLMLVAQAYAALEERDYLVPDDVKQATLPVLRHRMVLRPEAELEGYDADRVLSDILAAVPVPKG